MELQNRSVTAAPDMMNATFDNERSLKQIFIQC